MSLPALVRDTHMLSNGRVIELWRAKPAVAVPVEAKPEPRANDYPYERQVLHGELNRWGGWIERHSDYEGYPGANILVAFLQGRGGGVGGHRVLCLDMPWDIWVTHSRIVTLHEDEQVVVWLLYAKRMKEDGTLWTLDEKLRIARISLADYRNRIASARRKIMGISVESKP
jgi:hypothetical protein